MLEHVLQLVRDERLRQDAKWGVQHQLDVCLWMTILGEEYGEACQAALDSRPHSRTGQQTIDDYCAELVQVAAVAVAALEDLLTRNVEVPA